ncbi:MAG: hypothetical protein GY857_13630 [Desulfobacula sp.]|nr:hypothetical protein [Desulfobacula sp.]
MNKQNLLLCLIFFTCIAIIIPGCAPLRPDTDPLLDQKALILAKQVHSYNDHIIASRGTALARLETGTNHEIFKIAWAAVFPNKIRITFLISANPIETIISTGEKITFISHTGKHSKHSFKSKDPDLEKYIHVPIKMSEMILLLLGRLWPHSIDDTYFAPSDTSLSTIVLNSKNERSRYFFHFDDTKNIDGFHREDYTGNLVYKIIIKGYKTYGLDIVPGKLEIKDSSNRKLNLEITNFISNPAIKRSIFQVQSVSK